MSNIKINAVPQRIQYTATGGQTQFTVPFPFFQNNFLYVWFNGVQIFQGGAPGEYTVSGAGSPSGGLVTLNTAAILNDIVTIEGIMPIDRTSIYSATISNLTGSDLNGDFNREVVMLQQLHTTQAFMQLQYAPWALVSQDLTVTKDRYLPLLGAQQVWQMNAAGTEIEAVTIDTDNIPAPSDAYYWLSTENTALDNSIDFGALTSGLLKHVVTAGISAPAVAISGTDYWAPGNALTRTQIPSSPNDVTNKLYVDSVATGFNIQPSVRCASTTALTVTYNNGISGVGATLTNAGAQAVLSLDGVSPSVNDRILIHNQASQLQNGIYTVTDVGSVATNWVLTRATDFDTPGEINPGDFIIVVNGTTFGSTSWIQTNNVTAVGTDPIAFIQFSASIPVAVINGGTGLTSTTINQILYSSANNVIAGLATQASSVLITSAGGVPSLATALPAAVQDNINAIGTLTSNVRLQTGLSLQTDVSAGNTLFLQAYDVDGAAYVTFLTLTANNTPTCDLSTAVTIGGNPIGVVTPWVGYTPTFTGFGTPSTVQIFSRRVGGSLQIKGRFTAGTSTAVEARMTLGFNGTNANVTSSGAFIGSIQVAGCGTISFPFAGSFQPLIEQSVGYITFGILNAGVSGLTKQNGDGFSGSGTIVSIFADIPITGW